MAPAFSADDARIGIDLATRILDECRSDIMSLQGALDQAVDRPTTSLGIENEYRLDLLEFVCEQSGLITMTCGLLKTYARGATEFGRMPIVPKIPLLDRLSCLDSSADAILPTRLDCESSQASIRFSGKAAHTLSTKELRLGAPYLASTLLRIAAEQVRSLESIYGNFHAWTKRPNLMTCESLTRSLVASEGDAEDFLDWLAQQKLGLHGAELNAYIAHVLMGTRKQGARIVSLPGDMTVKLAKNERDLRTVQDPEMLHEVLQSARQLQRTYGAKDGARGDSGQSVEADQLSVADLLSQEASTEYRSDHRWRVVIDWDSLQAGLDPRLSRELQQFMDGASVEEMGKANYEHLRTNLGRIRRLVLNDQLHKH